ncbi:MAG: GNAT family N-acetyltransferase [Thiomonas sp.]|jgi:RimJ/RimL family protein N-acetyltransferase
MRRTLVGRYCRLEPVDPDRHAAPLFSALAQDTSGAVWAHLPYGPFASADAYAQWLQTVCGGDDPLFFAIVDAASNRAVGIASYLRITPQAGSIEIGHLLFSPQLQRHTAATEAVYLLMRQAFTLGYRRLEWKCDTRNLASRRAAARLGFRFEGVFRQAAVVKGHNRDTAWFSVIDAEWPALDAAFRLWLAPENFDAAGRQHQRLSALTAAVATSTAA